MKKRVGAKLRPSSDLIELEPFGVAGGVDRSRPVMLFREKGGEAVLPVWLAPVEAGIAITQGQAQPGSPHDVGLRALNEIGVRPQECRFSEIVGNHQYVEISFSGSKKLKTLRARADQAISFCLQAKTKFLCTRDYMEAARVVDAAQLEMEQDHQQGRDSVLRGRTTYLN